MAMLAYGYSNSDRPQLDLEMAKLCADIAKEVLAEYPMPNLLGGRIWTALGPLKLVSR